MQGAVINSLRIWSKRILPKLPLAGSWFERGFRVREARFHRRQRIAELQARRATARLWRQRIADVLACLGQCRDPSAARGAGSRDGGEIIMHNGLRVAYWHAYGADDTMHLMRPAGREPRRP